MLHPHEEQYFKIKIEKWSATDCAFLTDNTIGGWVSDDQEWYLFDNEHEMRLFETYLKSWES